jgi:hypothetical protein
VNAPVRMKSTIRLPCLMISRQYEIEHKKTYNTGKETRVRTAVAMVNAANWKYESSIYSVKLVTSAAKPRTMMENTRVRPKRAKRQSSMSKRCIRVMNRTH